MAHFKCFASAWVCQYRNCPNTGIQLEISISDPWRFDTNPDPGPALFFSVLQDANEIKFFPKIFAFYLPIHQFSKITSYQEVTKLQKSKFS